MNTTKCKPILRALALPLVGLIGLQVNLSAQDDEPEDEEIYTLSPFEVSSEGDVGYISNFTLSGNLTNIALEDVPASISVMTTELLDDLGAEDLQDAMEFATGVVVQRENGVPGGNGNSFTFRGIQTNWQARDNFRWYVPSDNYNVERLEVNLGPVGMLYGESAATGALNISTKRPIRGANFLRTRFQIDSEGSWRNTLDWNKALGENWALRLNTLVSEEEYWRGPAHDDRLGFTAGLTWSPSTNTHITATYEWGEIERAQLTNHANDEYSDYVLGTGSNDPSVSVPGARNRSNLHFIDGVLYDYSSVEGTRFGESNKSGSGPLADFSIVPEDTIVSGDYNRADVDFWVAQIHYDQTISENFSIQIAANFQSQTPRIRGGSGSLRIDTNPSLPDPNNPGQLIPNPNYEKFFVRNGGTTEHRSNIQEQYRIQGLYDLQLPFMRQELNFGAYMRRDEFDFQRWSIALDPDYAESIGRPRNLNSNRLEFIDYIDDGITVYSESNLPPNTQYYRRPGGPAQFVDVGLDSLYLNSYGRYFEDRLTTMIGIRHDEYDRVRYNYTADGVDGEGVNNFDSVNHDVSPENDSVNYGLTFDFTDSVTAFYNYSESFTFSGVVTRLDGSPGGPRVGDGDDFGLRFKFLDGKVRASITRYENAYRNIRFRTPPQDVVDEINDLLNPGQEVYSRGNLTRDEETEGEEIEIVAQPLDNLSLRFSYSNFDKETANQGSELATIISRLESSGFSSADFPETQTYFNEIQILNPDDDKRYNWTARYRFTEGPLEGFFIGTAGYWREDQVLIDPSPTNPGLVVDSYVWLNLFGGYRTTLFDDVEATFRLNVENVLDESRVFGAPGGQNFLDERLWTFSLDLGF